MAYVGHDDAKIGLCPNKYKGVCVGGLEYPLQIMIGPTLFFFIIFRRIFNLD